MKFKRIFLIVLDSLGVGEAIDASAYGDKGCNTLGNILKTEDIFIPNLKKLGFLNTLTMNNQESEAYYTIARPKNKGKDSLSGHYELMGMEMKEEYKRDLVYFIGDLLRRLSLDYIPDEFDIRCQYSDVLPLLMEYLFLRDCGKEKRFSDKHLQDLKLNANQYIKIYEKFENNKEFSNEQIFLRNSLLYLVPLSSMDATLQISDEIINDKESLKQLIKELIENENHNREDVLNKRNINTYGFKRLRKEITNRR